MVHPAETLHNTIGSELDGKVILHMITSSISCFVAPMISRELQRHGAKVIPVMTAEAAKFIDPMIFEWATGITPIISIEGKVEHVVYCGLSQDKADLVLIAPITANSISKIANGIMDNAVTLMAGTALGNKIPMIIVPTMHEVMMHNPAIIDNLTKLKEMGVQVLMPRIEEEKAKIPEKREIVDYCIKKLYNNDLVGKKILVTAGPTRAYIDNIRFISNPSSGKMGIALALEGWYRGAEVKLVHGAISCTLPEVLRTNIKAITAESMYDEVISALKKEKYDSVILAAAMNDFGVKKQAEGKIKSSIESLTLELIKVKKLADKIKEIDPDIKLVLFKAEYEKTDDELISIASERMDKASADLIVANDVAPKEYGFESDKNRVAIIDKQNYRWVEGKKKDIAKEIFNDMMKLLL